MGYSRIPGLFIIENIKISALCFPCVASLTRIHALNCHNLPSASAWDKVLQKNCSLLNPVSPLTLPFIGLLQSIKLEKAMAPHSSTLAWKILWTEEPGRLQTMGSRRVRHDWTTSLSFFPFMHWRRKWQPTPVFLPGESQGQGSLVGRHLWGLTELDTTEAT